MSNLTLQLSPQEQIERTRIDSILTTGAKTFLAVGAALIQADEQKLWRNDFKRFEDYIASHGISKSTAYRFIANAKTVDKITKSLTNGTHSDTENIEVLKGSCTKTIEKLAAMRPARAAKLVAASKTPKELEKKVAKGGIYAASLQKDPPKINLNAYTPEVDINGDNPSQAAIEACYQLNKAKWNTLPPASPRSIIDTIKKALA